MENFIFCAVNQQIFDKAVVNYPYAYEIHMHEGNWQELCDSKNVW